MLLGLHGEWLPSSPKKFNFEGNLKSLGLKFQLNLERTPPPPQQWALNMRPFTFFAALIAVARVVLANEHPDCSVDPSSRVDAWDGEFNLHDCEALGYCWSEAPPENPGPSCYHHAEVEGHASEGECTAARQTERRDCLPGGGDAYACVEKGCCWMPSDGEAFCYYTVGSGEEAEF
jgi:hypothetical protein